MKTAEQVLKENLNTESLTEKQYDAILEAMEIYAALCVEDEPKYETL
jgi:hypothetical protein